MTFEEFAVLVGKEDEAKRRLDHVIARYSGADVSFDFDGFTLAWLKAKARVIHAATMISPALLDPEEA